MYHVFFECGKHVCFIPECITIFLPVAHFMCLPTHSLNWYMHELYVYICIYMRSTGTYVHSIYIYIFICVCMYALLHTWLLLCSYVALLLDARAISSLFRSQPIPPLPFFFMFLLYLPHSPSHSHTLSLPPLSSFVPPPFPSLFPPSLSSLTLLSHSRSLPPSLFLFSSTVSCLTTDLGHGGSCL